MLEFNPLQGLTGSCWVGERSCWIREIDLVGASLSQLNEDPSCPPKNPSQGSSCCPGSSQGHPAVPAPARGQLRALSTLQGHIPRFIPRVAQPAWEGGADSPD